MVAGYAAFLQLYTTQPLLPLLKSEFHADEIAVSLTITLASLGVAVGAPIAGTVADRWGRKKVIVWSAVLVALTSLPAAFTTTLPQLLLWRFLQGLCTPGIFSVAVAYVNDEWPRLEAGRAVSYYISGTVFGGFSGRTISGFVAHHLPWRDVFLVIGALNLICAAIVATMLPRDQEFHRTVLPMREWTGAVRAHLANRSLLATFVVGFCVLFSLVGTYTYITFRLAAPPFNYPPAVLGSIFFTYVIGALLTPLAGRGVDRFGHRATLTAGICSGVCGVGITLIPSVWAIAVGLTFCCAGVFAAQASTNSFIGLAATKNRALASGLYAAFYHTGGSVGAAIPGFFYKAGGWPATAAFVAAVQAATVLVALRYWGAPACAIDHAQPSTPV